MAHFQSKVKESNEKQAILIVEVGMGAATIGITAEVNGSQHVKPDPVSSFNHCPSTTGKPEQKGLLPRICHGMHTRRFFDGMDKFCSKV
jgi:hypothetical protein